MMALPEKAIEPAIASARPGQSGGGVAVAGLAGAAAVPGAAAALSELIAAHSRERPRVDIAYDGPDMPSASPRPPPSRAVAAMFASWLDAATAIVAWLVLPLALLLFAQWPLRDLVGAWSRQANDVGQWLFALYVAFALRAATRGGAHLAAGLPAAEPRPRWRRIADRYGEALLVLPWAVFVVVMGAAATWRSVIGLEAFPDTFNPLYFVIRLAAWLLGVLMAAQSLLVLGGLAPDPMPPPSQDALS